jgi:deoxyhypusine synthase
MMTIREKVATLSPGLQAMITFGERPYEPNPANPVSNFIVDTKLHCNGGKTTDAGLWLRDYCDSGKKIFLTMSGAGSSFQVGKMISKLIRAGKIAGISVTGANMEESLYRAVAHSHYAYIRRYEKIPPEWEKELDRRGLRRITDTFLPEEESVRIIYPELLKVWQDAEAQGISRLWHEHFFELFRRDVLKYDPEANLDDCWFYQAWKHSVEVFVPGFEDSTMGNVFTQACYDGSHPFLSNYKLEKPVAESVVKSGVKYMHRLSEWYMDTTKGDNGLAFLQLGGGIAADFPICVVPHLKKDYLADATQEEQEKLVPPWAGFIEIGTSPMSVGSYSGAGYDEKITWSKFEPGSFGIQIFGDYTEHFPDIAALVLRM